MIFVNTFFVKMALGSNSQVVGADSSPSIVKQRNIPCESLSVDVFSSKARLKERTSLFSSENDRMKILKSCWLIFVTFVAP